MSTAKRPRRRQTEAKSPSPQPVSKKLKTSTNCHVPTRSGLEFLVDEDARAGRQLEARLTNGVPGTKKTRVDESHALVAADTRDELPVKAQVHEIIEISSGEEESSEYVSEEDEADRKMIEQPPVTNGHVEDSEDSDASADQEEVQAGAEDDRMEIVDEAHEDAAGDNQVEAEPSFGEMLTRRYPGLIDVHALLPEHAAESTDMVPGSNNQPLTVPSGTSLSTVLSQALRTNDKDMLERCFKVVDMASVKSTIERLRSSLAAALLQKLAERIHKSPGRTGYLMVWVQWTIVTHGGNLSSQPEAMARLRSLAQVVRERANGLQPLLHLKGKLDLLSSQLEYREKMQSASRAANAEDDEDDDAVIYVEGQNEEDWSEDEDEIMENGVEPRLIEMPARKLKGQLPTPRSDLGSSNEDDDESEDGMPNGIAQEVDEDSSSDDAEEGAEEGLFDDEADVTSDDDADEESEDEDASSAASDVEVDSSDSDSEPEIKQPNPKMLNRKR
ncbi:Small subunit (SSU) processome component [Elasticomyces elasticus]|nr:Small subunit (SSU) processome component [Elasticomyces elasticus]KAK3638106.1 Small subunit (SSU) processome component [Elasticomyces elasticus]KAK4906338.1 Small subunit (SSU) processome component [Elasticomyces elasticus]KAK5741276.1 Small subunit (SSU) processome component [Elasticomyces elasticus]